MFQSDSGGEFISHRVRKLFEQNGTLHRLSCPHTPQQNGRVERKHRSVVETGLAMLFNSNVPASYWVEAFSSAVFILNRLPTRVLGGKSPFEMLFHYLPDYSSFRTYGCRVYPCLRDYAPHKLAPRSLPCVFIGYNSKYKGYMCLEPTSSRVYITRHARFDELSFPFKSASSEQLIISLPLTTFLDTASSWTDPHSPKPSPIVDTHNSISIPLPFAPLSHPTVPTSHELFSPPSTPTSSSSSSPPTSPTPSSATTFTTQPSPSSPPPPPPPPTSSPSNPLYGYSIQSWDFQT
ncbi:putative RNA-directed DNA polymerase [Helianthus debilis subsp. tardiflorus]